MKTLFAACLICLVPSLAAAEDAGKTTPRPTLRKVVTPSGAAQVPGAREKQSTPTPKASEPAPGSDRVQDTGPPVMKPVSPKPTLQQVDPSQRPVMKKVEPGMMKIKTPDLTVTTKAPQGNSLYYNFTIKNMGEAQAPVTVIEISLGPPCTKSGIMSQRKVLKRDSIKSLKVTTSSSMAFKYGYVLDDWAGTGCQLQGEIDPDGQILESNENNNLAAVTTAYHTMPDLTIVWSYGEGPHSDDFGVKNIGDAPAPASTLYMNCSNSQQAVMHGNAYWPCDPQGPKGEKQWSWSIPALSPGQSHMVSFPLSSKNPSYTAWHAYADHGKVVDERNEQNNGEHKLY